MHYYANFKDIGMVPYQLDIYTAKGDGDVELTLCGTPAIVTYESSSLFSPIKSQSCTIEILTETAMLDLYTMDPRGIRVVIHKMDNNLVVFRGYVTPCQYGQNWTWKDTLSLECVECLSALKYVDYSYINGQYGKYVPIDTLICYLLSKVEHPDHDELQNTLKWNWPQENFKYINGAAMSSTKEMLQVSAINEANFFDDDQENTPWTCYEVLEEICKFFNVTLTMYNGQYYFIDYLNVAKEQHNPYISFWQYTLDKNVQSVQTQRDLNITTSMQTAGTMEIGLDDVYNKISVDANRYDINELVYDMYDKNRHKSLTVVLDFSGTGDGQTYTESHENFWGDTIIDNSVTTFKTYCVLDNAPGWKHIWWSPRSMTQYNDTDTGYSTAMNGYSQYISLPENKYINTIGATILHYAQIQAKSKPSQLDWKDVIMFNCLTDTIKPSSTNQTGKLKVNDIFTGVFEKPVLEYTSPNEMNFSPKDGTSWIVINNKLWYQQNKPDIHNIYPNSTGKVPVTVTDTTNHKQIMFPLESATSAPPYVARQYYYSSGSQSMQYSLAESLYDGWEMLQMKLQIGNKYWNGTQWTTTPSTFYIKYSGQADDASSDTNKTFSYLSWMDIVSNTTYQEKVGTDGYAIPISMNDGVCGIMKLTIYTPRLLPHGKWEYSYLQDQVLEWYERGPVVFMKDFSVDYVYTDTSEWWLDAEHDKKDLKYTEYTSKSYKYERIIDCKINSWQEGSPIAKSFPIAAWFENNGTINPQSTIQYIATMKDEFTPNIDAPQEENICSRQLRHYSEPRMKVKVNIPAPVAPWAHVTLSQSSGLSNTIYVVDKQSFDLRNRNNTLELIEFGDTVAH